MSRWSRWVGLLDRREPAVALAMYRIAIGSCLLYAVGTVWAGGLVEAIWMDIPYGGYRNVGNEAWLVELAGGASPEVVWPLVIGSVVAGLATLPVALQYRDPRGADLLAVAGPLWLAWSAWLAVRIPTTGLPASMNFRIIANWAALGTRRRTLTSNTSAVSRASSPGRSFRSASFP